MKTLKLGIMGLSPGNGHPYSWSAICNGYDAQAMATCPFPVIPQYLSEKEFPADQLKGVMVTHVWTQDKALSQDVAKAALIPNIVDDYRDLIGVVDAVLLARDDAENHLAMSQPFLEAGMPIYIDKPLAFDTQTARHIFDSQQYPTQIFTASALGYAPELSLSDEQKRLIGKIKKISAQVPKDWFKYSVHIIEPVLKMIDSSQSIRAVTNTIHEDQRTVSVAWSDELVTEFSTMGSIVVPINIEVVGTKATITLTFTDTYRAFKNALQEFIHVMRGERQPPSQEFVLKIVDIIEKGSVI